jgi:hypothetical protein
MVVEKASRRKETSCSQGGKEKAPDKKWISILK